MYAAFGLFIGGELRRAADGATAPVMCPVTENPVGEAPLAGVADTEAARAAAAQRLAAWRATPAFTRADALPSIANEMARPADDPPMPSRARPRTVAELKAGMVDRPILGAEELAQVKPGAILVNTARGGIVDEAALVAALADGRVAAAGLDVFDAEPPAADHPLLAFDQVVLTPHIAALTRQAAERMAVASVQNVLDFFAGRLDPDLIVNKGF